MKKDLRKKSYGEIISIMIFNLALMSQIDNF